MNGIEKDALEYAHALEEEILPAMGDCGLWNKEVPATMERKRNLLFVIANRKAKLKAQAEWMHSEQERYRQLRCEDM